MISQTLGALQNRPKDRNQNCAQVRIFQLFRLDTSLFVKAKVSLGEVGGNLSASVGLQVFHAVTEEAV
jgi:hypothetical protein